MLLRNKDVKMISFILVVLALVALGIMNRKGIIEDGEFAVAVVLILSGIAGYIGLPYHDCDMSRGRNSGLLFFIKWFACVTVRHSNRDVFADPAYSFENL